MVYSRKIAAIVLASATVIMVPSATAQLAPGLRAPETKLDAIAQAHTMSCFLAVAARPVPGLNMDMPDNMGEGHFVEKQAPDWLASAFNFENETNYSRASSGQGDIWIAFETKARTCTIATQTGDPAELKSKFIEKEFSDEDWKPKKVKSGVPSYYQMKLGGLKFRSEFPKAATDSKIFAVKLSAK